MISPVGMSGWRGSEPPESSTRIGQASAAIVQTVTQASFARCRDRMAAWNPSTTSGSNHTQWQVQEIGETSSATMATTQPPSNSAPRFAASAAATSPATTIRALASSHGTFAALSLLFSSRRNMPCSDWFAA